MAPRKLKFLAHCMEGTGSINPILGFSQVLRQLGHECVLAINESLSDHVHQFGFRLAPLKQNPSGDDGNQFAYSKNPAKDLAATIDAMGIFQNKNSLEKMIAFVTGEKEGKFMENMVNLMIKFNPQLETIIEAEKPDCFLLDHFLFPPAFGKDIPCIIIGSAQALMLYNTPELPPPCAGYPVSGLSGDRSGWEEYSRVYCEGQDFYESFQAKLNDHFGFVNNNYYDRQGLFLRTPFLTVNQCPKELDYRDIYQPPENIISVDTFCRQEVAAIELPAEFQDDRKLIYLSMGSMGSFDIELMKRLSGILSRIPGVKTIVSKGPRGDEYELPANCWGRNFLPQPAVVEMVDLVITHGGNNSVCETFQAGKPMIVMPLFGDQFDNAQRVAETGYGRRFEPYDFRDEDLVQAIQELLADKKLEERLRTAKLRIQTENTKEKAAKLVEELLQKRR